MKQKTKKWILGSISILMIIIMLPMMTMSAIIVDSSRINMARSMVSSAGDLAMNSALADYDTIVKDVYGLFAMSQNKSQEELSKEIKEYFKRTLVSYGVVSDAESEQYVEQLMGGFSHLVSNTSNENVSNFLNMTIEDNDISVTPVKNSSLAEANILRSQIVEYMKYRAPISFGLSFLDSIKAFKNVKAQNEVVVKQVEAQESSQDVTSACKNAITEIRLYDKIVKYANGDTNDKPAINDPLKIVQVKGKSTSTDGQLVGVLDYDTQVDKYRSSWGTSGAESYEEINRYVLVFLANSPETSSKYLAGLNVNSSKFFINSNNITTSNSGVLYNGSGIPLNPSLESSLEGAKNQVTSKINELGTGSTYYRTATNFLNAGFVSQDNIGADTSKFSNADAAFTSFINYEKFLTDDSSASVKYSDVKAVLENIYILGKYYDNWNSKITAKINEARTAMNNAINDVNSAGADADNTKNEIKHSNNKNGYVDKINTANTAFMNSYESSYAFLEDYGTLYEDVQSVISKTDYNLPSSTVIKENKSFVDFSGYLNKFKEFPADSDYIFLKTFKEIINNTSLNTVPDYEKVCNAAKSYLSDLAAGKTSKFFSSYMTSTKKIKDSDKLYKLLNHLYTLNDYVKSISDKIIIYDNIKNGYDELVQKASDRTTEYNGYVKEQGDVLSDYSSCVSMYGIFGNNYQHSLNNYNLYIKRAKSVVDKKVSAVKKQFGEIKSNVKTFIDQLDIIDGKLDTAKSKIEIYVQKLGAWNSKNNEYANSKGSDSFSKQNTTDYEASLTQYDLDSLETLRAYLKTIREEYNDFYKLLTDDTHYKYGSKKIDKISKADDAVAAVSGIKSGLSAVVTKDEANSKFASLYGAYTTPKIVFDAENTSLFILDPVLPLQFLKYLNETYPEPDPSGEKKSTSVSVPGEATPITVSDNPEDEGAFNYDNAKNDLKSSDESDATEDTDTNKYKYKYDGRDANGGDGEDMPSEIAKSGEGKKHNTKKFGIDDDAEDTDQINASSGLSEQSGVLDSILGGIGNVLEKALEQTYILSYIFNNFSYNTIVQDNIIEAQKSELNGEQNAWILLNKSDSYLSADSTQLSTYFNNPAKTLSNYKINENNNFLYGAEIEYVLFGNKDAKTNVTSMKASIYAIRFAFNCIYAFTDSSIKTATMSVGLAVQAATLGIVPYQIVQVVLQLALAAAEAAMDLKLISNGIDVAVVKSKDTWSLSISSAVTGVGNAVAGVVSEEVARGIKNAASGLQGLVDAGADKVNDAVRNLSNDLQLATEAKMQEVIDAAVNIIQSKIEEKINEIQFKDYKGEGVTPQEALDSAFNNLSATIQSELNSKFGGNPIADKILPDICTLVSGVVDSVKSEIQTIITDNSSNISNFGDALAKKITEIKLNLMKQLTNLIGAVGGAVEKYSEQITSSVKTEISGYIDDKAEQLSEEASEAIKTKVTDATNKFVNDFLSDTDVDVIGSGSGGSTSSSVASIIKFGYKEYLMLFTYIGLFTNETKMLTRVADLIQLNIKNAGEGAEFKHSKGSAFRMSNAYTYVSMKANIKLDMLFMNMDFFTSMLDDGETEVEGDFTPAADIVYNGLLGY